MGFDVFAYPDPDDGGLYTIELYIWGTNNAPVGWTAPTVVTSIIVTRPGWDLIQNIPASPAVASINILGGFSINLVGGDFIPGAAGVLTDEQAPVAVVTGGTPAQAGEWGFAVGGLANTILPGDTVAVTLG